MEMRSGPEVSGRSRRVAADQGWSLRGVPLYTVKPPNNSQARDGPFGLCREVGPPSEFFLSIIGWMNNRQ